MSAKPTKIQQAAELLLQSAGPFDAACALIRQLGHKERGVKFYVVIGRIPGDDEDTCLHFECRSRKQAVRSFERAMYDGSKHTRQAISAAYGGETIYINQVLYSETPINED